MCTRIRTSLKIVIAMILLEPLGLSSQAEVFRRIDNDESLFSTEVKNRLESLPLEFRGAIWPTGDQLAHKFLLSSVSPRELYEAERWIKSILRPEWVPDDLKGNFIPLRIRLPFIPPQDVDYLITRYEINRHYIQIMENGVAVQVLVVPLDSAAGAASAEDYITTMARKFLSLPEERIEEISVALIKDSTITSLYYGTMDNVDKHKESLRKWWHQTYVWSEANHIYFGIPELEGVVVPPEGEKTLSRRPGIAARF